MRQRDVGSVSGQVGGGTGAVRAGFWAKMKRRMVHGLAGAAAGHRSGGLEQLEPRLVLAGTPLPALTALDNVGNAVVRFETTAGDVDIELFTTDSQISTTTSNFLNYITSGRLDDTFFHRSVVSGIFVVQGGGFIYEDGSPLRTVATDAAIPLQDIRSNRERTISMARTNTPDSGTSQFFFNVRDNLDLDRGAGGNPNQRGYAVFGRVIQGWNVIQNINSITPRNLTTDPNFTGPQSGNMGEVPLQNTYNPTQNVQARDLFRITNAEVVKPAGAFQFYADQVVYPEGFRSPFATETIELVNPNPVSASYQIIARYEDGQRDTVITSGTIAAGTTLQIKVWDPTNPGATAIRNQTPYALVIDTAVSTGSGSPTTPTPIAASFSRTDFGATVGDAFFNAKNYNATALQTWDFPRIERNSASREFITWANLSDQTATVTVNFYNADGISSFARTFTLKPYRRGGINLFAQGLPDGLYSARVTSDQAIVAAMSDYDSPIGGGTSTVTYFPGWGGIGQPGGGATTAALGGVEFLTNFASQLSIFNPNLTPAVVTLNFWRTSRTDGAPPITKVEVLLAQRRKDFDLSTLLGDGVAAGEKVSVTYTSGSAAIALSYTSVDSVGRGTSTTKRADGVHTAFQTRTGNTVFFADGLNDPTRNDATQDETLALFNPFSQSGITYNYTVSILFSDSTELAIASGSLIPNGRLTIDLDGNAQIRAKANTGTQFRNYAIVVSGIASGGSLSGATAMAPVAALVRRDTVTGASIASLPTIGGGLTSLGSPIFTPGGGSGA